MTEPEVQAHSALDDDDSPMLCPLQMAARSDDVVAHSAVDEEEPPGCVLMVQN